MRNRSIRDLSAIVFGARRVWIGFAWAWAWGYPAFSEPRRVFSPDPPYTSPTFLSCQNINPLIRQHRIADMQHAFQSENKFAHEAVGSSSGIVPILTGIRFYSYFYRHWGRISQGGRKHRRAKQGRMENFHVSSMDLEFKDVIPRIFLLHLFVFH